MNSKKNFVVYLIIFMLLALPFFSTAEITTLAVELVPIQESSAYLEESIPKLFPEPRNDQIADYYGGSGIDFAFNVEYNVRDIFPFINNPNNRLEDLSIIQMILASIDMFYVTNDSSFLLNAVFDSSSLNLDINSTYISGAFDGSEYEFHAEDNLLLVIAYCRLAQALGLIGDSLATIFWDLANITMDGIVDVFYHSPTGSLNTTRYVLPSGKVEGGLSQQSAKSTGLFTMANNLLNDSSVYYTETKNTVDFYLLNVNSSVTLLDASTGYLFKSTNNSGTYTDNEADLQGNLYMNTALLQHCSYQLSIAATGLANYYFDVADIFELTLLELFRSPDTGMFHSIYDLGSLVLKDTALTYDNCLALSHIIEFNRMKYDFTGSPQSLLQILPVVDQIYLDLFVFPAFFEAGITITGSIIYLDWMEQYKNPIIVNAQAITMLTKILPLDTMLLRDQYLRILQETSFKYYLKYAETSSIFGSSNSSTGMELKFSISSQSNLNVSYITYVPLATLFLDGNKINNPKEVFFNFSAEVGGEHEMAVSISHSGFPILFFTQYFYVEKEIGISTNPPQIRAVQGYDEDISLVVKCVDEQEISIKNAQVNITYGTKTIGPINTNAAGEVDISVSLDQIIPVGVVFPEGESTFNATIAINVSKEGYVSNFIVKQVIITLNSYILSISPSPPLIKEGDDLNLYLDVRTQIEATIWTKTAQVNVGDTRINDSTTGSFDIPLAASISIDYSTIKDAIEQSIDGLPILHIRISTNILDPDDFFFEIHITPLKTLERMYSWIEIALQSSWVKVLTSLTVVWMLLWKQFKLRILRTLRRCPHCGETGKSKYPTCRYCGAIIHEEKSPKKEPERDLEPPSMESGFQ